MYELWARRNDTRRYEYITTFSNEDQKYCLIDRLDKNIYYEVVVMDNGKCNMYREFEKIRRLKK